MNRSLLSIPALAFLLALLTPLAASAQDSPERRARIAENLKFRFEQLREASITVVSIADADIPGMDIGTLVINNQNQMRFLVTDDDTRLYLLAADAVDVSMDAIALAAEGARLARQAAAEAQQRHTQLLALSQSAPSLGPDDAPVTVVEFSDFQCPYCSQVVPTIKQLLAKYPEQVRVVFMDLPLNIHPWAEPAAIIAGCAARQSDAAFWSLHDYYFANQQAITPQNVLDRSRAALAGSGIDMAAWEACAGDPDSEAHVELKARVQFSMRTAMSMGATGTPAFFINGQLTSGVQPLAALEAMVEQALANE